MPGRQAEMGAIDPVATRQHVKTKSASVEAAGVCGSSGSSKMGSMRQQQAPIVAPSIRYSAINLCYGADSDEDEDEEFFHYTKGGLEPGRRRAELGADFSDKRPTSSRRSASEARNSSQDSLATEGQTSGGKASSLAGAASKAKNFLAVAMGGFSPLRPAKSASCLLSSASSAVSSTNLSQLGLSLSLGNGKAEEKERRQNSGGGGGGGGGLTSEKAPACSLPTRASLTHEWRKLRTPAKCRECNLLVYFNGRECACCAFVAHKKCLPTLVIKCHRAAPGSSSVDSGQWSLLSSSSTSSSSSSCGSSAPNCLIGSRARATKSAPARMEPLFGRPLVSGAGVGVGQGEPGRALDFVRRFIREIEARGVGARGIYRVSSIKSKVDRLCQHFDQNPSDLVDLSSFHPNIIANALKIYLRQLPEPLLTHRLYQNFIEIAKKYPQPPAPPRRPSSLSAPSSPALALRPDEGAEQARPAQRAAPAAATCQLAHQASSSSLPISRPSRGGGERAQTGGFVAELGRLIGQLPPVNRLMVALLMRHLRRVADMAEVNQMSAKNLSIIFGPTLLSLEHNKQSLAIVDNIHQARVVELLILWAHEIFPPAPLGAAEDSSEPAPGPLETAAPLRKRISQNIQALHSGQQSAVSP